MNNQQLIESLNYHLNEFEYDPEHMYFLYETKPLREVYKLLVSSKKYERFYVSNDRWFTRSYEEDPTMFPKSSNSRIIAWVDSKKEYILYLGFRDIDRAPIDFGFGSEAALKIVPLDGSMKVGNKFTFSKILPFVISIGETWPIEKTTQKLFDKLILKTNNFLKSKNPLGSSPKSQNSKIKPGTSASLKGFDAEICKKLFPILIQKGTNSREIDDILDSYGYKSPRDYLLASRWHKFDKILNYLYYPDKVSDAEFELADRLKYYLSKNLVEKAYSFVKFYNPGRKSYYHGDK